MSRIKKSEVVIFLFADCSALVLRFIDGTMDLRTQGSNVSCASWRQTYRLGKTVPHMAIISLIAQNQQTELLRLYVLLPQTKGVFSVCFSFESRLTSIIQNGR
jgi:hypothetical protein